MWIIPDTFQPSWLSAQDMVESKEDLILLASSIESSLMWRSKPSLLRTWLTRWNRVSWLPHLCLRMLKPSRHTYFEEQLISSLAVTRASRLAQRASGSAKTTPDTSGPSLTTTSTSCVLDAYFSRTLKDTSRLDSAQSSLIWKHEVTTRRGEYSARLKSAHLTRESESTSWPTPSAHEARLGYQDRSDPTKKGTQESLTTVVVNKGGGRQQAPGHLNPEWVAWLMGVPTGWIRLGS